MMRYEESGDFTTTLHRRLLYILNENLPGSTWYCIAMKMLQYYGDLDMISIEEMASLCAVSKSTISKFIRVLGYEDYRTFQNQAAINLNRKQRENYFVTDVMRYIDEHSTDAYVDAVLRDIRMTYELLDWEKLDRLAAEIYHYEKVAAFGCDFSETAALDLQTKLRDQRKFIVTNIDDQKQAEYIRNADDKTLVIVFSDSGEYVQRPQNTDSVRAHWAFENFRGKIVMITSNPDAEKNPLVDYCLLYRHCREVHTHRILYAVLTDLLAYRYHEYLRSRKLLKENRI